MKVGIITQPLASNYGGILQNYALQQVLKAMGHTPVTLQYMPSLSFGRYLLYVGKRLLFSPIPSKRRPIKRYRHYLPRAQNVEVFVRDHIALTKRVPRYSKRLLQNNGIEAIIVGSDQVWRYAYNAHYLEDMYLAFAQNYPCPKIAYGASFGVEQWDYPASRTQEIRKLSKQFKVVSVREDTGVALCKKNLGIDAITVLDPTLLLNSSDYEPFCIAPNPSEEPFLAAYVLDQTDEKTAYIETLAKAKGLRVKQMNVAKSVLSMEEWLSSIKNADYVITDSYHGSLFSILFKKQFQTILNKERGADRFVSLFSKLNLQAQLKDQLDLLPESREYIDYSSVYAALTRLREESLLFLKASLSDPA